ncbi:MAG: CPBP family intramembrane glutamic endopeptidase [Gemmatales bacterium]|nr:CPBP family intramembrane metalloprotease [Gemmatales bacterium]MDW7995528.1 CPBP family intramembrane glutamic endopeptidase [Gemmatales bacterium]
MSKPSSGPENIPPKRPVANDFAEWWVQVPEVEPLEPRGFTLVPSIVPLPSVPTVWPVIPPAVETPNAPEQRCAHCGRGVLRHDVYCRWCGARWLNVPEVIPVETNNLRPRERRWHALIKVAVGYLLLLAVIAGSAVWLVARAEALDLDIDGGTLSERDFDIFSGLALEQMTLAAIGSSVVVLLTWAVVGSLCPVPRPQPIYRLLAWTLGPFLILPVLLLVNMVYSLALRHLVSYDELEIRLMQQLSHWPWFWVLLTVQPALFEELFFRYLMLGAFHQAFQSNSKASAQHLSVFLSSLLFAIAHLGQPLHLPYLFLVGLVLGYLRLASGGLALPIIIHFLHNAAALGLLWLTE